jgi:nucleoside-diphosphate-sugar epimerase
MKVMDRNTHVILGFTGGIGRAVAKALTARNEKVVCLVRDIAKAKKYAGELHGLEFVKGDASQRTDVEGVLQNASTVYYCVNVPYQDWEENARELLAVTVDAAIQHHVKIVFPGNVYVYGHAQSQFVSEVHPHAAHTKKGKIRIEMEALLEKASKENGLQYTIIRMPDFYGPYVVNRFSEQFYIKALKGKKLTWFGSLTVAQEFIFIEDAGEAMVIAGLSDKAYGCSYNVSGYAETTGRAYLEEIARQAGKNSSIGGMNITAVFSLLGLFNATVKEFVEMLYLKQERLILDGSHFKKVFGTLPATSYEEGIRKTIAWIKKYYQI